MSRCACGAAVAVGVALLAWGCGADGRPAVTFKKGGPPAPRKCIERWNADSMAISFGQHAYSPGHDSRAGHAFLRNERKRGFEDTCAVVFAASESDREYGTLGAYGGPPPTVDSAAPAPTWQWITNYPVESQKQRIQLQRSGAEQANVALMKTGKIAALR